MSHQVNFYLLPEDFRNLERRLRELQPLTVIHSRSPSNQPKVVDSFEVVEDGKPWFFLACVRTEDLAHVILRHVPEQGYWVVDEYQSPVIELTCCSLDGRILRSGRLYYNDAFWGPDKTWVEKPAPFRKWAKSVFTATKKMLKRQGMDYIGPAAEAWLATSGGQFVQ